MRGSSSRWRTWTRRLTWLREAAPIPWRQLAAYALVSLFLALAVASYFSTLSTGTLTLRLAPCADGACVSWVMPSGKAWAQGARPGMAALSADGQPLNGPFPPGWSLEPVAEAELLASSGDTVSMGVTINPIGQSPMKFSLWALGAMFALLGVTVVLRRPDLPEARWFGLFAGFAALGLAVGPSAGGPAPSWALAVNHLALIGLALSFLPFVTALSGDTRRWGGPVIIAHHLAIGLILMTAYLLTVLAAPQLYEFHLFIGLYVALSLLGGMALLAIGTVTQATAVGRLQTRVSLLGTGLGTLPFIGLTLIPLAIGQEAVYPAHLTILAVGLMPAAFAYAILQHQLMGIRRLIHRGVVYGTTTVAVLAVVILAVDLVLAPYTGVAAGGRVSFVAPATVLGGIVLFFSVRRGARWLIDRFLYRDVVDYREFLRVVPGDLPASNTTAEAATSIASRLAEILDLESALLFVGNSPEETVPVGAAGPRADEVLERLCPQLVASGRLSGGQGVAEVQWESDTLLLVPFTASGAYRGHLLLGPKAGGDVFLDEQKRLVTAIAPMLALALDKSELAEDRRALNTRLMKAEEAERARIAGDLHDGPLQKALLIAGGLGARTNDGGDLARQLAAELREISSRLRPSILDDLGIVSASEWLLEGVSKRSGLPTTFSHPDVSEEDRFAPDIELALFRIAQEATNNILKHAEANAVEVSLSREDHALRLRVADDGAGFSTPPSSKDGGFGISGMRERAMQVNGSLQVVSQPGSGTTIIVNIPLE